MTIAYFDCIAGASGDMILGALLDAGLPEQVLAARLADLHLQGFSLRAQTVLKNGIKATKVDVQIAEGTTERRLSDVEAILTGSNLSSSVRDRAASIFRRLCEVEAGIHGASPAEVHLHELGGLDTIVDVVGCLAGLEALGVDQVVCSPLPLGRGTIRGSHGRLPLPAPATVALLQGIPVIGSDIDMELVTPTGAALLVSVAASFGPIPAMTLKATGYGAGSRDLPIPNVLRVMLGESTAPHQARYEPLVLLESNIDDMNPEIYDYVASRLFASGALDVYLSPIQMKKNRPATLLSVMCRPEQAGTLSDILFCETTTLGVRQIAATRRCLERSIVSVATPYASIRVKIAALPDGSTRAVPEYEDCRRAAEEHGVPIRLIFQAAERAAADLLG